MSCTVDRGGDCESVREVRLLRDIYLDPAAAQDAAREAEVEGVVVDGGDFETRLRERVEDYLSGLVVVGGDARALVHEITARVVHPEVDGLGRYGRRISHIAEAKIHEGPGGERLVDLDCADPIHARKLGG